MTGVELPTPLPADPATEPWHSVALDTGGTPPDPLGWTSALLVVLGRYAGGDEVTIAVADRPGPAVPLRSAFDPDESGAGRRSRLARELAAARERAGTQACRAAVVVGEREVPAAAAVVLHCAPDGTGARLAVRGPHPPERPAAHLGRTAAALHRDPDAAVGDADWLPPDERAALAAAAGPDTPADGDGLLHAAVLAWAARTPDRLALRTADTDLTYAGLDAHSAAVRDGLRARGVRRSDRVGICLERTAALPAALLGVLRAGGCYVPLDPAYPDERLSYMISDAGCAVVLADDAAAPRLRALGHPVTAVDELAGAAPGADAETGPADLAYVIYTSGSTGRPKGVAIEHRNAVALLGWAAAAFDDGELAGVLASTSVCFDLSVFELFATTAAGGTVHLVRDLLALGDYPHRDEITLVNTVPSVLSAVLALEPLPGSVRTVALAGERLPGHLAGRVGQQPGVRRLLNLYGPSEDTTYSTVQEVPLRDGDGTPPDPPIGRPLPGTWFRVVDARGADLPFGVPGELLLGGAGLARGYLGRPEVTAERFHGAVGDPGRYYRTGDRVRLRPDGLLEHLGRLDDQVKYRGFRIELGEITSRLREHPLVEDATVRLVEVPGRGTQLVAYPVGTGAGPDDLAAHLARTLPRHMVPGAFVPLPELPRTLNGKIDNRRLPLPAAPETPETPAAAAPDDEVAAALHRAWAAELGGPPAPGARFLDHANSLQAVQVVARLRADLRRAVPVAGFLDPDATAESLAAVCRATPPDAPPAVPPDAVVADGRLSRAERRLWLAQQLDPDDTSYTLALRVHVRGADAGRVHRALAAVLDRHVALRRCVRWDGGDAPVAHVRPASDVPSTTLPAAAPSRAGEAVTAALARTAARPFDLAAEVPARVLVQPVDGAAAEAYLGLVVHHSAFDDVSAAVLLADLGAVLDDRDPGPAPVAPDLVAAREDEPAAVARAERVAARWADGLLPASRMPRPGPPGAARLRSSAGAVHSVPVPAGTRRAARDLGRRAGTTAFAAAMTAFAATVAGAVGVPDVAVGVALAGRTRPDTARLVTCCVNTLPLAVHVDPDEPVVAAAARVGAGLADLLEHQDVPVEYLRDALRARGADLPLHVACGTHNGRVSASGDGGPSLDAGFLPNGTARLDLTLWLEDLADGGWQADWTYATDLLDAAAVDALHRDWVARLAGDRVSGARPAGPAG